MDKDYEIYRNLLRPDKHALDNELMLQADILERISTRIALMTRDAEAFVSTAKRTEAGVMLDCKAEGMAVAVAEATVRRDPGVMRAHGIAADASAELAQWRGLYEAWKAKGYSLKELVTLYAAQYFSLDPASHVDRSARPQVRERRDYTQAHSSIRDAEPATASRPRRRVGG